MAHWLVTLKPTFQTEWLALPAKEGHQVMEKIQMLLMDPTPAGKVKKQLKHKTTRIYRLRAGDYRIFYTYEEPYISLLSVRKRKEDTYDDDLEAEFLGGYNPATDFQKPDSQRETEKAVPEAQKNPLPEPITTDLLDRLRIPSHFHQRLTSVKSQEQLLSLAGVPDEILLRVDQALFERPLEEIVQQPDFITQDVSDLMKFKEGDLLGFLLKLDPEQEKYVDWALNKGGPTLLKGGPGTGKSTIALYRVKSILDSLPADSQPRILFTTYTNALVAFSKQLLEQLIGDRAKLVEVRTADSLIREIAKQDVGDKKFATPQELKKLLRDAILSARYEGGAIEIVQQKQSVEKMNSDYLLEEILSVIEARGMKSLDEYLSAPRSGRRVPLNEKQRTAIWTVRNAFQEILKNEEKTTWEIVRNTAEEIINQNPSFPKYDAIVIDEVQDLSPTALRILFRLCKEPNSLFVTADANQAIYGNSFRWGDVHEDLKFKGRTGILRANHRSTQEIGLAANSYLGGSTMDESLDDIRYAHSGPLPVVRIARTPQEEMEILTRFIPEAMRTLRQTIGSVAVLVPTEEIGQSIAGGLLNNKIAAEFMPGKNLDLRKPVVKVITAKSAKGLEFPIVVLAGFITNRGMHIPKHSEKEAIEEITWREKRTLYVAMTRAMRALLVIAPPQHELLCGFSATLWNT